MKQKVRLIHKLGKHKPYNLLSRTMSNVDFKKVGHKLIKIDLQIKLEHVQ